MDNWWFKFWVLMLALFGIVLFIVPVKAQEPRRLAVCNEAAHAEELATAVIETDASLHEYATILNERVGTGSCGTIIGIAEEVEQVKEVVIGGMRGHVIKVRILAVYDGQMMRPVGGIEQYTVALHKKKGTDA